MKQGSIGNVEICKKLTKNPPKGGFNDNREAHHMPSQKIENNKNVTLGFSIQM
jgi:hypothetical protein